MNAVSQITFSSDEASLLGQLTFDEHGNALMFGRGVCDSLSVQDYSDEDVQHSNAHDCNIAMCF